MPSLFPLTLSGSSKELGKNQADRFGKPSSLFFSVLRDYPLIPSFIRPFVPPFFLKRWLLGHGKKLRLMIEPVLKNYFADYWTDYLAGLAEGYGVSLDEMYGCNAIEFITAKVPLDDGCTSLVFSPNDTEEKISLLAYNHDYLIPFSPFLIVRQTKPVGLYASLGLSYWPLAGAIAGVNEAGLGISLNHGYTSDSSQPGIPFAMIVQSCLDRCSNVREAISLIERLPVVCGGLISLADENGDRASFELTPSRRAVRDEPPKGLPLFTFNQYQMEETQQAEVAQNSVFPWWIYPFYLRGQKFHAFNWKRRDRFLELTQGSRKWSVEQIKKILQDHGEEKIPSRFTICRHHPDTADTVASTLIFPAERKMQVCLGKPCKDDYLDYSL